MANWCRSLVLAVGDEAEISRFLEFTITEPGAEETAFTESYETGVMHRYSGAVRIEVVSRSIPPLDDLVELSRELPHLKFAVKWEQPGDRLCGSASIANGDAELVRFDGDVYGDQDEEGEHQEEMMSLRYEIMRRTCHLLFGPDWRDEGGQWDDDSSRYRNTAHQIAKAAFAERAEGGQRGGVSQHFREGVQQVVNTASAEQCEARPHDIDEGNTHWKRDGF